MKEYYLRQLRQKVVDETFADFNLIEFEGKGLTPEMLTEAIDSYPAMADKKLIIVQDFDLFKAACRLRRRCCRAYLVMISRPRVPYGTRPVSPK